MVIMIMVMVTMTMMMTTMMMMMMMMMMMRDGWLPQTGAGVTNGHYGGDGDQNFEEENNGYNGVDNAAGPQKNNLIKSLISEVDPHVPQIPGMQ